MAPRRAVKGFVTFLADCPRRKFQSTRVRWGGDFPFVTLETTEAPTLAIQVECKPSQDAERTVIQAREVAERIVREICCQQKCSIGRLMQRDTQIVIVSPGNRPTVRVQSVVGFRLGGSAQSSVVLSSSSIETIVATARDVRDRERDSDLGLVRSALQIADPIGRFVLLYAALQHIIGAEFQDDVDDWVWNQDHSVPPIPKPNRGKRSQRRPNPDETTYTAVRTSIAHVRDGQISFDNALEEARQLKSSLEHFVDLALAEKYPGRP